MISRSAQLNYPYKTLEAHPFWHSVKTALEDLATNQDLTLTTDKRYAIGYLLSKLSSVRSVFVDWAQCHSLDDFYDMVLPQCGAPAWHGRNLHALSDSWVTGGIDGEGPPFAFWFLNGSRTAADLLEFRRAIEHLAEASVTENGGEIHKVDPAVRGNWR